MVMNEAIIRRHKGVGIWSFGISLAILLNFILIIFPLATIISSLVVGGDSLNKYLGIIVITMGAVDIVALGLGIAGLTDKSAKKLLPVLGSVISTGTILLLAALIHIGLRSHGY